MTDPTAHLHLGFDPAAVKARVLTAISRAETGDLRSETQLTFESWQGLTRALSDDRLALLRHLRQNPDQTADRLADALDRRLDDVALVIDDLLASGLIERSNNGQLSVPFTEIRALIEL